MRKLNKKNGRLWGLICALVLFTGIAVATACSEDKDCKTCTNAKNESKEYCDDALDTLLDSQAYKDGTITCK